MVAKEVKQFAELAREGALRLLSLARATAADAGADSPAALALPGTRYYLPLIFSLTGIAVETTADVEAPLEVAGSLIGPSPAARPWHPYLGTALDAGISALISGEIIAALSLTSSKGSFWFPPDEWVEKNKDRFLAGGEVGFVVALGDPGDRTTEVLAEFADKKVTVLGANGAYTQAAGESVIVLSDEVAGQSFAFGTLTRMAMLEGVSPGNYEAVLDFCRTRLFGFVALFADEDPIARAFAAGGISFGLATIVREYTPQLLPIYSVPRF
ncbi:MAG: hypothetical protein M1335_05235 [Chloroflexi bacterium]|nr:hypothetical protein [Chloroflexota bacterium]